MVETKTRENAAQDPAPESRETSRLLLIWDVLAFQFKLAADGLRDLLLSPISIVSAILGLVAGGDDPHRYFRQLLRFGRRSEAWINLFGHRRYRGTSDELIAPLKERLMSEAQSNPWLSKAGGQLNRKLDDVGDRIQTRPRETDDSS